MKPIHVATLESRNFEFEGVGETEAEAVDVLIQGMRQHASECGISHNWWYSEDMRAASNDGKPRTHCEEPRRLVDDGLIQVRTLERGAAYRNREPLQGN